MRAALSAFWFAVLLNLVTKYVKGARSGLGLNSGALVVDLNFTSCRLTISPLTCLLKPRNASFSWKKAMCRSSEAAEAMVRKSRTVSPAIKPLKVLGGWQLGCGT